MFMVADEAHWPEAGVNVYAFVPVDEVVIFEGFQVPGIPLVEDVGNVGALAFRQRGAI